jgi:hypothetical protein
MKAYSDITVQALPRIVSSITLDTPNSGFSLMFGYSTGGSHFQTGFGFSGYSGYVFDYSGLMIGGYRSGAPFEIESNIFKNENRVSYFVDGVLINNNLSYDSSILFFNKVEFEKYNNSTASITIYDGDSENYYTLLDSSGIFLYSFDNLLLKAF